MTLQLTKGFGQMTLDTHLLVIHRNYLYLTINTPIAVNNCIYSEKMDIYNRISVLNNLLFTEDETKTT